MTTNTKLLLGTASPRRHQLIRAAEIPFSTVGPTCDEIHWTDDPCGTVAENAMRKMNWCRERHPNRWILCADTVVEFAGHCLGKPRDIQQAHQFLTSFSGKAQQDFSAVSLYNPATPQAELRIIAASVTFKKLSPELIQRYLSEHNMLDRAGAYDVNTDGDWLIEQVHGCYTTVMGLPLNTVWEWLQNQGYSEIAKKQLPKLSYHL